MPNKGLITALEGSRGSVRALRRDFGIRNLLPELLGFLVCANKTSEDRMRNSKIRNWHAESGDPGFLIFNSRIFCIIFFFCRTAVRGAQFLKPMIS